MAASGTPTKRIVAVPNWVPLMISVALSGLTIARGASLIEIGPLVPRSYQQGFEHLGFVAWGWILIATAVFTLVCCALRPYRIYIPLLVSHAIQAVLYGTFTSIVLVYGKYTGATPAWVTTLLLAGMHIIRVISLVYERLTDLELPNGPR